MQTLIHRHLFALRLLLLAADAVIAALLFIGIGRLRFGDAQWPTLWAALGVDLRLGALVYATGWVATLWLLGLYSFRRRWTITSELQDILVATLIVGFGTMSFLFLARIDDVSRWFLLILMVAQPIATTVGRVGLRLVFGSIRARGYNRVHMIVIGLGEDAEMFANAVERHRELGIVVIGHLRGPAESDGTVSRPILGDGKELGRIFHEQIVDEVAICLPAPAADWTEALIRLAADEGKHVRIPTPMAPRNLEHQTEELDGMTIRSYVHSPARMLSLAIKRSIDVVGAFVGLILLSPVFLGVAIAILVAEGRPILFDQTRVGLHGRPFTLFKFRTMDRDAEARYQDVAALSDTKGAAFTMRNDPRVTRSGAFLRRSSLDELPQLWNVLKGDMSLIGPRPAPPREVVGYDIWHRRRLSMRPGITGLSQVRTRLDAHFDDRAQLDLAYIDQWSLGRDIGILLRTVPAVFGWKGE